MLAVSTPTLFGVFQRLPKRFCSSFGSMVNVRMDDKSGYATVELNHPPVNALNLEFLQNIDQNLDELIKNQIRGLILTSSSNKVFCAGLDIKELCKPDMERASLFLRTLEDVWFKLFSTTFPTAAAINGHSPAGGCMLALTCEYRVMMNNFTIGLNETRLGIDAPSWLKASMLNVMSRRDTEMALTLGTMYTTEEALKVHLIDDTTNSKDEALRKCETWLDQFKQVSAVARTRTKLALRGPDIEDFHRNRQQDHKVFLDDIKQERFQEELDIYLKALKNKKKMIIF